MRASILIQVLQERIQEHGDLEIMMPDGGPRVENVVGVERVDDTNNIYFLICDETKLDQLKSSDPDEGYF